MQACPVKLKDLEIHRKKEEEKGIESTSQSNLQQKSTKNLSTSNQHKYNRQQENTKRGGQDQTSKKAVEHQKENQVQNEETAPPKYD